MTYPKLICPIETVANTAASQAWADAKYAAIDAGLGIIDALRLADAAKAAKLAQMAPMIAAYNAKYGEG